MFPGTIGRFAIDVGRVAITQPTQHAPGSLEAAREMLEKGNWLTDPAFHVALQAVLEVLPVSAAFSKIELTPALSGFGSDFEALENLRRIAFRRACRRPQQLTLFR